jgi:iron complex outermembrane receptor protein
MTGTARSHKALDRPVKRAVCCIDDNKDGMTALKHHSNTREGAVRAPRIQWRLIAVAVLLPAAPPTALAQIVTKPAESQGPAIEEIVVTATRRAEPLSKVAISVSTFSAEQMDDRGVKDFDDLVRLSPGLNLTRQSATGANQISIRGISSDAGSGTTGVYIDDTPIQVRNLGFGAGNAFPGLFDVERVEVLRGPQGTLFGAGSEGGTVRFITKSPNVSQSSIYVRGEVATLSNGSPTYEGGVAFGAPIIPDQLGFRVSAFFRHEGGWINEVDGTYQITDPTGASYGQSVNFKQTSTIARDVNWNRTSALRAAFKWTPNDSLTISPAVFHQEHHLNDGAGNVYDLATSNPGSDRYSRQGFVAFPAGTVYNVFNPGGGQQLTLNAENVPQNAFGTDKFTLSSIALLWDVGAVQFVSNTSYFDRKSVQWYDYTKGYVEFYLPQFFVAADGVTPMGNYAPLGWKAMALYNNAQGNFIQELRLQSKDSAAPLTWVAGVFYSHDRQSASEPISENFLINSPWVGFYPTASGFGYYGVTGGPPFGPGSTAAQNFFGDNMLANAVSFLGNWLAVEQQIAGFAQADYKLIDQLKLTAGVRVSHNKLDFTASYLAPENNSNAPFGFPCPVATCTLGSGALTPSYPQSATHSSETAVTPKAGVSFQPNDANMLYATAAKGFRPAGASLRAPTICNGDLINNGYVDSQGNPVQPTSYKSDSLWSYELGSKSRLFGGRLVLDGSVYEIKWKNIQVNVPLPNCAYNFVDNLANATSKGFDVAFELKATENLDLSGSFGYNKPTFDRDALSPGGKAIYKGGSSIPDAGPPESISVSAEYVQPLAPERAGYVRVDYTHTTQWRRFGTDEYGTPSFDPLLKPIPAYGVWNLRFGARFGRLDVSAFVQNLADSAPALELFRSQIYDPQDWQNVTLRPRTYGLTAIWRN